MIHFTVPGVPAPGGSKKAFAHPKTGKIVVLDDARDNAGWRARVAVFARRAMEGREPLTDPLQLVIVFRMPRPKRHYGTGRNAGELKPWARSARPATKPDVTKLIRAAEDAMTGIVWRDDALVVEQLASKVYGEDVGMDVAVKDAAL